jgi:NADH pyrophosphatase NudC (nudix superfamily)
LFPPVTDVATQIVVKEAKSVGPEMSRNDAGLVAAAGGLLRWQKNTKFCQKCGSPVTLVKSGHKAVCVSDTCRAPFYPILMPAVLTLCTCGEYALLGRNSKWPRGFYSCLAGFVDQSESLEQAVAREVLEESGIAITPGSAVYASSQPWPFPCQLMVGFRARVDGKPAGASNVVVPPTPAPDIAELRDARWFHRDWLRDQLGKHTDPREDPRTGDIPVGEIALPGSHALARQLVESWVAEAGREAGGAAGDTNDVVASVKGDVAAVATVALEGGMPVLLKPPTNRSFAFAVVELSGVEEPGSARKTILRFQATGGGGAPTANDHTRISIAVEREAARLGGTCRVLGGGQLCFRGGEVSESAERTDEYEASMVVVIRNGGGGDSGGQIVDKVDPELIAALIRRAYPMHDILTPGAYGAPGSEAAKKYQY